MKTEIISTRIDLDTKLEFTQICEELGLSTSQALKLFAKAVIAYGGIPFELKVKQPNQTTIHAIKELEEGQGIAVESTADLFHSLGFNIPDA